MFDLTINPPYQFIDPKFGEKVSTITLKNVNVNDFPEVMGHINKSLTYYNEKEQFFNGEINSINYDAKTKMITILCNWNRKELPKFKKLSKK